MSSHPFLLLAAALLATIVLEWGVLLLMGEYKAQNEMYMEGMRRR